MKTRVLQKPLLNEFRFMRPVIVQNQMDIVLFWYVFIYLNKEFFKLGAAMSLMAFTKEFSCLGVECSKKGCCSMALIIMSSAFCLSRAKGEQRLGAVQRLYLTFFIYAVDKGILRRIHV